MRIVEILGNVDVQISNEEADLLKKFQKNQKITKHELTEREQTIANSLTIKHLLIRKNIDGKITYFKND